jgi:hypothetical protein
MDGKPIRFSQLLELHLNNVVKKKFTSCQLTSAVLCELRETLREQVSNVFAKGKHRLTFEALVWLTDQYFKAVKVNDDKTVEELIVINEYKLDALPYCDIELLHNLFNETKLGPMLEEEYRRRNLT